MCKSDEGSWIDVDHYYACQEREMRGWQNVPRIGSVVKASHPITCLNPDEFFEVFERKFDGEKIFVRGEKTCWFHLDMISPKLIPYAGKDD